jgi:hypothetical protein
MDKFYPNGSIKAKFIRYLKSGECCCNFDNDPDHYTDGNKVYKKIEFKFNKNE